MEKKQHWYEQFVQELKQEKSAESKIEEVVRLVKIGMNGEKEETVGQAREAIEALELDEQTKVNLFAIYSGREQLCNSPEDVESVLKKSFLKRLRVAENRLERKVDKKLGAYIHHLRTQRKMSLQDVEKLTGVSASYIYRIEKSERKMPSFPIVEKLAQAFDVPTEELLKMATAGQKPSNSKRSLETVLISEELTVNGQLLSSEEKQLIIKLLVLIDEADCTSERKVSDSIQISDVIERIKISRLDNSHLVKVAVNKVPGLSG